jgi:DNA-binding beta-propeller fold protein YncE
MLRITAFLVGFLSLGMATSASLCCHAASPDPRERSIDRSPVDLAISPDRRWLVTANEASDSVSLVSMSDRQVCDEITVGQHPADIEFCPDGKHLLVTAAWSGRVDVLSIDQNRLTIVRTIEVGFEPYGIAVSPIGNRAFVGLVASGQVAEVDWQAGQVIRRIDVGNWPRYLTLSPDAKRLTVGCSGDSVIAVVDAESGKVLYEEPLANGINLGHMLTDKDGTHAYFTWMVYRSNPITVGNIRRGWVLASRIGRVSLDGPSYREAISLDVPGKAVADPLGLDISQDQQTIVASASGTHELLVYRLPDLPFEGVGGPGDLIDQRLENDRDRFMRIDLGGRPMGLRMAGDNQTVFVANYLRNSVQVVDLVDRQVVGEVSLGQSEPSLVRHGMSLFYDGTRSLDQWYSCHSCHQNGGGNSRPMDTMNDGTEMSFKTVLPLFGIGETGPWTWHGWQNDLDDAMNKSFTSTMQGKAPREEEKRALIAFLCELPAPPNPFLQQGQFSEAAKRGKLVFESSKAGCADCHNGPYLTDGMIHDVGSGSPKDRYDGYNTPSLLGVYRKLRLLHSGRARSLDRVVTDLHSPEKVNGEATLSEQETSDLIEYLRSL